MQAQERFADGEAYVMAAAASARGFFNTTPRSATLAGVQEVIATPEAVCAEIAALPTIAPPLLWRMFEIVVSLAALVLFLPLIAAVALIVRLDSPGPILFRQRRVGRAGRLFSFTKFRTFYVDAKEKFPHLYAYSYSERDIETLCFKVPNDPRATRAGRWLRKTTLDELPNFWNVLTGDMALVGPRPEIPEMLPYYRRDELSKFSVRPGVTGLAQVSGRGWLSFRDTVSMDVQYVQTQSPLQDFRILIQTIERIVLRHGAF